MMCSLDLQGDELCKLVRSELRSSDPISAAAGWGLAFGHCADGNLQTNFMRGARRLDACLFLLTVRSQSLFDLQARWSN